MPTDYRIEFSRLLPSGGPGNLGILNPLDNLLVRAKPAGADASSSSGRHQDSRARPSAQQKSSRATLVPPRGAPADAAKDVIDLTSDQEDELPARDDGDEDTDGVIDLTDGNPTPRKAAAAAPVARHHREPSNTSMQARLSAARAPASKAVQKVLRSSDPLDGLLVSFSRISHSFRLPAA